MTVAVDRVLPSRNNSVDLFAARWPATFRKTREEGPRLLFGGQTSLLV
jgi:hypothetical protein